jgi:type I restriction enzyme S subunit
MSQWENVKLESVIFKANTGADAIQRAPIVAYDTGTRCLRIQDISQNKNFLDWGFCKISDQNREKFLLKKDDILIARTGATIGSNLIIKDNLEAVYNNGLIRIIVDKNKCLPLYLFYNISFQTFFSFIDKVAKTTSTQPNIRIEVLLDFTIPLPPLPTQRKIAAILSAYDDLIENNTRRIAILEAMARLIYREWFVHFRFPGHEGVRRVESELGPVPEGWKVKRFSEATEISPSIQVDKEIEKPFVEMADLSTNSMVFAHTQTRTGGSGSKFQNNDILFPRITPSVENGKRGFVQFLVDGEVGLGSTEFIVFRAKSLCPEYVYFLSCEPDFRDHAAKSMVGASGRQRVQNQCFDSYLIAQPTPHLLSQFSQIVVPMFKIIQTLSSKNTNLRRTRDLLLPRLISGEVDVAALEIAGGN